MNKNFISSACKSFTLVFVFAFLTFSSFAQEISTDPAAIKAGEALFNANCKACHRVKQKLVGPALAGVQDRAPSIQWIKDFVHNSSKVIASGDEYAVKLYNEYNKTQMTAFTGLKDQDIMNILAYIQVEGNKKPEPGPTPGPGVQTGDASASGAAPEYLNVILIGMIIILILLIVILGFITTSLKRFLDQRTLTEEEREV